MSVKSRDAFICDLRVGHSPFSLLVRYCVANPPVELSFCDEADSHLALDRLINSFKLLSRWGLIPKFLGVAYSELPVQ